MKKSKKVLSIFSVALVMVFSAAILAMHPIAENFTAGSIKSSNFGVSTNNDTATVNLSDGCVEISKAETEGYINVGMVTDTETGYNCIPNNYVVKIVQTSEETANTIKVADNCGTVNIVLDGVNIVVENADAINIGSGSDTTISTVEGTTSKLSGNLGIFSESNLTLDGTGELELTGKIDAGIYSSEVISINGGEITSETIGGGNGISVANDLIINNSTVKVTSTHGNGIYVLETATITGSTVDVAGNDDGIVTSGGFTLNSGTVTAKGKNNGMFPQGEMYIYGGEVTATAENGSGIHANNVISISSGKVTAIAESNSGIYSNNIINVSGGEVTATGNDYGIYTERNVEISGGKFVATGKVNGIYSKYEARIMGGVDIEIYGGASAIKTEYGITIPTGEYALYEGDTNSLEAATRVANILNADATATNKKYVAIKS